MDKLAALRVYAAVYLASATQLATSREAREWMESMDFRAATRAELEAHAKVAAEWASIGMRAVEALPLIASGMTPGMVVATDPTTDAERMERLADRMEMLD
ncbi:hypothetical protein [Micromonospora haikouensis]|uniref:hypothetical protein n=1 Tax=Micromonospora haikouensis TaxID=686309 RepID=UPI003D71E0DE